MEELWLILFVSLFVQLAFVSGNFLHPSIPMLDKYEILLFMRFHPERYDSPILDRIRQPQRLKI